MRSTSQLQAILLLTATVILTGCGGGGGGGSGPQAVSGGDLGLAIVGDAETGAPSSLVSVSFFVRDDKGLPIPGLQTGDFQILENDEANSVFESSKRILRDPRDFAVYTMLLLDLSDSIRLAGALPTLVDAAKTLARGIFESEGGEFHRMGVFWFDGSEEIHTVISGGRFSAELTEVLAALDNLPSSFDPSTNLYGAIVDGLDVVDNTLDESPEAISRGNIVLFTDGRDNAGRIFQSSAFRAVDQLVHEPGKDDGKLIESLTIGLGGEIDRATLERVGRTAAEFPSNVTELIDSFEEIAERINNSANSFYRLEYCSPKRAGSHRLTIKATHEGNVGFLRTSFDASAFTASCDVEFVEFDVDAVSGPADESTSSVAVNSGGERFIAGNFDGEIQLGSRRPRSQGGSAGFVGQVAPDTFAGGVVWARAYTAPDTDVEIKDIALTGSQESATICGSIRGSLSAVGEVGTLSIRSGFVTRLDPDGDPLWTRAISGSGRVVVMDVEDVRYRTSSGSGTTIVVERVAIAGHFEGRASFADPALPRVLTSLSGRDGFIAIYTIDGELKSVARIGTVGDDEALGLTSASDGTLFVTGFVGGDVTRDGSALISPGYPTGYVAQFTSAGTRRWIHAFSDPEGPAGFISGSSTGITIGVDADDDIFVAGRYTGDAACDDEGPIRSTPPAAPNTDAFVAKLSTDGTFNWCRSMGSQLDDEITRLAVDSNGDVTVVGTFRDTANLGGPRFTAQGSGEQDDVMALRLSGFNGRHLFGYAFGGLNQDRALGVAVGPDDNTHVVGFFSGSASFIDQELHADGGGIDGFLLTIR